jgi:hypothetical protein
MAKKKDKTPKAENRPEASAHVIPRVDQALKFPEGWDREPLHAAQLNQLREYLREFHGADSIETERHAISNKIEGKPRKRFTALFFVHTVTEGNLIAEGITIPPRKGQLVILPAGVDWKILFTTQPREVIEFTF